MGLLDWQSSTLTTRVNHYCRRNIEIDAKKVLAVFPELTKPEFCTCSNTACSVLQIWESQKLILLPVPVFGQPIISSLEACFPLPVNFTLYPIRLCYILIWHMQCYFFIYMNLEQKIARNTTTQIADRRLCTEMSAIRDLQDWKIMKKPARIGKHKQLADCLTKKEAPCTNIMFALQ